LSKKLALLLAVLLIAVSVHAQESRLRVVASFSILADVARNVAGDAADVATLVPPDADPHAYTPAPTDLAAVADADVVLINGAQFEQGLLTTVASVMGDKVPVVASTCVEILPFGAAPLYEPAAPIVDDASAQRCAAHVGELDAVGAPAPDYPTLGRLYALNCTVSAGEEQGGCDPHVWFNPYNVELWTLTIRDTLSVLDPANADVYAHNAAAYIDQVEAMRQATSEQVTALPDAQRELITDHEALGYFAATYQFRVVGVVVPSLSTLAEPSAQEIAALIDTIRAEHDPAIFAGSTVSPTLSRQVADEAGAQFYTLYAESLGAADGPAATYLDFMRYNVQTVVEALS
jgi:ABC-type Zn uptake system ZnuABC Zn-binding protein ZnuA